jgi:hypothetical protein
MANTQLNGKVQPGLSRKPYSAGLGILVIVSDLISMTSAWLLAFDFLGYHAPGRPPHPIASGLILVLGLSIAAVGQLLGGGRHEGIGARGWVGVIDVVHIRLSFAALVFVGCVLKYAIAGKTAPFYPVGLLTIVSGIVLLSRSLTKYVFRLDRRKRTKR